MNNKKYFYLIFFFADLDETDVQSNEYLQKFFGALPLIGAMLAAIGYQFGLSPIAWSYSGKFPERYHLDIKLFQGILKNQKVFTYVVIVVNITSSTKYVIILRL